MLPIWFGIALVPGAITLEAPHASRLLDAIIPLALLIGVAADLLLAVLQAALPRPLAWVPAGLALLAALLTVVPEYRTYFVERERRPEFVDGFAPWESAPGRYLAAHAPTATVFLDPITYWSAATQFTRAATSSAPERPACCACSTIFRPPGRCSVKRSISYRGRMPRWRR
jgi:hypothetical protein